MRNKKNELVLSAISLVQIGERLEKSKEKLGVLVARGIPYESEKMKEALDEYLQLKLQWERMEAEHLKLKEQITEG
jgi:hypothetical protein